MQGLLAVQPVLLACVKSQHGERNKITAFLSPECSDLSPSPYSMRHFKRTLGTLKCFLFKQRWKSRPPKE